MGKSNTTEGDIITAAKAVFVRKGFDGARMQEIADEAGINKALLHYYFRSKDRLFDKVFEEVFREVFKSIAASLVDINDFEKFLEVFVYNYTEALKSKSYLPQFVFHELNRNPGRVVELLQASDFDRDRIFGFIRSATAKGIIEPLDPIHLVTHILSLCVFPFIAKPIIQGFMLDGDEGAYRNYIDERPEEIIRFVKSSVMRKKTK